MPERRNRHPDAVPFPTSTFDFVCPSGTADRLIATKEEVAMLRKRFEVELERQAAKAAKMAVASANGGKGFGKGGRGKRERQERDRERVERAQQRAKAITAGAGTGDMRGDQTPESIDSGVGANTLGIGGKAKNGKKKKRSALANASNPHHLRNYVPSRLPHSGPGEGGAAAHGPGGTGANANANTLWPLPLRFLSSEIPPRRGSRAKSNPAPTSVPLIQLTHPAEEWICAFCEYDLFYGEDAAYRRAVRNRKKILKRRRRARERAAAAASGASAGMSAVKGPPPPPPPSEEYDAYEDSVVGVDEFGSAPGQRGGRWKGAPDKEEAAAFG
ncbi:hypothetical protein M413DRAFT_442769 [Hebeloma cylindrosporum]|uniref:Uncharacterized protein n=1 Tax=Hebeloma cylindrosporum TaxID=76867 RepID=A0A0C3CLZ9_HEBCY|nr:hypothetical protein M413DRAFT_442769 [Hebeloma cylindrosporum h7]